MKKIIRCIFGLIIVALTLPIILVGVVGECLSTTTDCCIDALEAAKTRFERIYGKD